RLNIHSFPTRRSSDLFFDLYATHKKLFGKHQFFNIFFGEETPNFKSFQYSNGLLTQGSKKLMEKYAYCLKQNGLDFTIIGERPRSEEHTSELQSRENL